MKLHCWHLLISNMDSLNVKCNLNNNVAKTHNIAVQMAMVIKNEVGNWDLRTHNTEVMKLSIFAMMVEVHAMK